MNQQNPQDPQNPQDHRYWREMLGAYTLGELGDDEQAALRAHLDGCSECQAELAEIQPVARALADADPGIFENEAPRPPADLLDRTLAQVEREREQSRDSARVRQRVHRRRRVRRATAIAAAAAVVVAVGLFAVLPQIQELRGPPQEQLAISAPADGVQVEGSLIAHTWGTEANLVIEGLDDGQRYQVAFTREDGTTAPAGTFIGTEAQPVNCNLNAAVLREDATRLQVNTMDGELVAEADLPQEPANA
jgi:anti-sigma factor RsiW